MNRLAHLIGTLGKDELSLIQKDLVAGTIDRLVQQRLHELQPTKTCPTCGNELSITQQKFSLEFGPQGLRQRATFDELDCLTYFIEKLKPSTERAQAGGDL